MKNRTPLLAFSILVLAALACNATLPQAEATSVPTQPLAQNSDTPQVPQTEDQVPRIRVKEAKAALDAGQAIIVDVRSAEAYAAAHVVGALSIPLVNFENNINDIPLAKDQWIITYCT